MYVCVVTAAEAAACDRAAISSGTPSQELMRRAGDRAAHVLSDHFARHLQHGVRVYCGPGNNGGDGYILARALAERALPVECRAVLPPASDDCRWAAQGFAPLKSEGAHPAVVVDALLGTGARGPLREPLARAAQEMAELRARGVAVVSLDLPSGLDATTGVATADTPIAHMTISFGHHKRGVLARRDLVGAVVLVDIGLGTPTEGLPHYATVGSVHATIPPISAVAHKGSRKKLLIVGGAPGMAGASILAAQGALASGIGMVRLCSDAASLSALQAAVPAAVALTRASLPNVDLTWPDALVLGPGFGVTASARAECDAWLERWKGPILVDADVFTLYAGPAATTLGAQLVTRPAIATPHYGEAARMLGVAAATVGSDPYRAAQQLARVLNCTVLLKGVPTVIATGDRMSVAARGTPALATGGSGDLLSGITATLLAQGVPAHEAAVGGAWTHGRAAEIVGEGRRGVRGSTLDDVREALIRAWEPNAPLSEHTLDLLPNVRYDTPVY